MSMKAFRTSTGAHIHVFPITITMGEAASFRVVVFSSTGAYDKNFNLEGVDYKNWGRVMNISRNTFATKKDL